MSWISQLSCCLSKIHSVASLMGSALNTINARIACKSAVIASILAISGSLHAEEPGNTTAGACHVHFGWRDTDGDGIADIIETADDTDGDGIPNYLDLDSDNDATSDDHESWTYARDPYTDVNQDGVPDGYQALASIPYPQSWDPDGDGIIVWELPEDSDLDGIPNYLDVDSDGDGLTDIVESHTGTSGAVTPDYDGDGLSDFDEWTLGTRGDSKDSDGGGVSDGMEVYFGTNPLVQGDDYVHVNNLDSDGDGIPNELEKYGDPDGDKIPNFLDLDSDNDGWYDIREAGLPDLDSDGLVDDLTDLNDDGLADVMEGLLLVLPDTDGDNVSDMFDKDSDNDGLWDANERPAHGLLLAASIDPFDIDADGINNNADPDSDNDGLTDHAEAGLTSLGLDLNNNGVIDGMEDQDDDGIPDASDTSFNPANQDSDSDGIIDEHDADTIIGSEQGYIQTHYTLTPTLIPIYIGDDSDGDGIVDQHDHQHNDRSYSDAADQNSIQNVDIDDDGLIATYDAADTSALGVTIPETGFEPFTTSQSTGKPFTLELPEPAPHQSIAPYNPCETLIGPFGPVPYVEPGAPITGTDAEGAPQNAEENSEEDNTESGTPNGPGENQNTGEAGTVIPVAGPSDSAAAATTQNESTPAAQEPVDTGAAIAAESPAAAPAASTSSGGGGGSAGILFLLSVACFCLRRFSLRSFTLQG